MSDVIKRGDAITAINRFRIDKGDGWLEEWEEGWNSGIDCAVDAVDELPSAELTLQTPQTYGKSINPSNAEVVEDYIRRSDGVPQSEQYKKGFEDAKRAFELEFAREAESIAKRNAQLEVMLNIQKELLAERDWIPCSERLPDIKEHHVSGTCHVYCENRAYGFAELEENIFGQVGWNCEREDEYHEPLGEVIAWMPLPKPYREDGEE